MYVAHRASTLYKMRMLRQLENSTGALPHNTPDSELLFGSHTHMVKLAQRNENDPNKTSKLIQNIKTGHPPFSMCWSARKGPQSPGHSSDLV